MATTAPTYPLNRSRPGIDPRLAVGLVAVVAVSGIAWAKWDPYSHKLVKLLGTRVWSGSSLLAKAGHAGASPSWAGAWRFTVAYGKAVWVALVAALVISAAFEALIPRRRVAAAFARRSAFGGAVVGGLLALPCMMCTCCGAPVSITLRRQGAPTGAVLGYWIGNPVLNPAVLVFLALVAPWQWVVTRVVVGGILVFGVTTLVARGTDRRPRRTAPVEAGVDDPVPPRAALGRFVQTLLRLGLILVPEYFIVVMGVGLLRGWLFPVGHGLAHLGILAVVVAAVAGTLVVVPTAGEIPILLGLGLLGLGLGPVGALLITLPAISLPSMVMVGRTLTWRVTAAMAGGVVAAGLAGALCLWALG